MVRCGCGFTAAFKWMAWWGKHSVKYIIMYTMKRILRSFDSPCIDGGVYLGSMYMPPGQIETLHMVGSGAWSNSI